MAFSKSPCLINPFNVLSIYISQSMNEWDLSAFPFIDLKYICSRLFLMNRLSMVSEKLWFVCSSSVSV